MVIDDLDIHQPTKLRLEAALDRLEAIQGERRQRRASGTTVLSLSWLRGDIDSWSVCVSGRRPTTRKTGSADLAAAIDDLVAACMTIYESFRQGRGDGTVTLTIEHIAGEASAIWVDFEEHVSRNGPRMRVGA